MRIIFKFFFKFCLFGGEDTNYLVPVLSKLEPELSSGQKCLQ